MCKSQLWSQVTAMSDKGMARKPLTYSSAGVDIDLANQALKRIKPIIKTTYRSEVLKDIGGFGGLFSFPSDKFSDPVLVASTDGVGTKAQIARQVGRLDTIGIDLVAMCLDDLVCEGAEPLFMLDYIAAGYMQPDHIEQLVSGIVKGCLQAGCALIGGELAEHRDVMGMDEFDLAGFAVGVVERNDILGSELVSVGDKVIGIFSDGLRCNGYSLARKVLLSDSNLQTPSETLKRPAWKGATHCLADELLKPSLIYSPGIVKVKKALNHDEGSLAASSATPVSEKSLHAVAHITGGGIEGNLSRVLPNGLDAVLRRSKWPVPLIFGEIQRLGSVSDDEMEKIFNLGLGMIMIVDPKSTDFALKTINDCGFEASLVGEITAGDGKVTVLDE